MFQLHAISDGKFYGPAHRFEIGCLLGGQNLLRQLNLPSLKLTVRP